MASACLPMLFQAVEIDGEAYWDGGYMGNPALFPLFYEAHCDDILLVQINPLQRKELPTNARAIQDRLNEITFNAVAAARTARHRLRQPPGRRRQAADRRVQARADAPHRWRPAPGAS